VIEIVHFSDPGCPWAWSASPHLSVLHWRYGDQLRWRLVMIGLTEHGGEYERRGYTAEGMARGFRTFRRRGMPFATLPRHHVHGTWPMCRAVVAARLRSEQQCGALLRRLRVLCFSGAALDDPEVIARAATEAGIDPGVLRDWTAEDEVEAALRADMRAARSPSPASRAQDYKLGGPPEERRYTCPSYELERTAPGRADWPTADRVDLPGFRPVEAYEAAIANLAPELTRRPDPESAAEVLAWAGVPLATVEVAAVMDREPADVRGELARGARFEPVGVDGYWSPR
jgi:2-hydroxychromene-2-carboxylate isomerase